MSQEVLAGVPLRAITDPMSGFFLVRRSAVDAEALRPRGFKILLEILLSGRSLRSSEVPFRFGERNAGASKASLREGAKYLRRLVELRAGERARRLVGFAVVGALGVGVNTAMLALLVSDTGLWYPIAAVLATQVAILFNYALADRLVFRRVEVKRSGWLRLAGYVLVNNGTLVISSPLLVLLVSGVGIGLLAANVLSLALLVLLRFAIADSYIWRSEPPAHPLLGLD